MIITNRGGNFYNNNVPYSNQFMQYSSYGMDFSMSAFNTALSLIREALQGERNGKIPYHKRRVTKQIFMPYTVYEKHKHLF